MLKPKNPCDGVCAERNIYCHSTCKKYKKYAKLLAECNRKISEKKKNEGMKIIKTEGRSKRIAEEVRKKK